MSTHRYAIPIEQTKWELPDTRSHVQFNWEYDEGRERLLNLYDKGKKKQWDAAERIDWSLELDMENPEVFPDQYIPIHGSHLWDEMDQPARDQVRHHMFSWLTSQFLHGEQGALICSAKIVETVPEMDSKFYAATQVMDEARHVEAYARLLNDKIQMTYPINKHLQSLLDQTISDNRWDFTYLGMQVMVEGVALAAFSMIRDFTTDPLARSVNAYVMQDEARHVAFGRLALKDAYADLTEAEREEREEFVIEASYLLRDRFLAEEVWENLGLPVEETVKIVDQAQIYSFYRKALFSRVVPCVKDIGLFGPKVQKAFVDLGVMEFQDIDLEEIWASDSRVADDLEAEIAAAKNGGSAGTNGRGAQIAETINAAG